MLEVARTVNGRHPAGADLTLDLVAAGECRPQLRRVRHVLQASLAPVCSEYAAWRRASASGSLGIMRATALTLALGIILAVALCALLCGVVFVLKRVSIGRVT